MWTAVDAMVAPHSKPSKAGYALAKTQIALLDPFRCRALKDMPLRELDLGEWVRAQREQRQDVPSPA